jgi:alanyl-tRNA synthetase
MYTLSEIRNQFLRFFNKNNHQIVPSSSLIPQNDPTLMFTNAGMVQFKDIFLEKEKAQFKRAVSSQKCVRAGGKHNDLENVGHTARHHTFFEMLGNFSFGDYFKEEAINYAWDFITKELSISENKLYVTVYHTDQDAYNCWQKILKDKSRIIKIGTNDNFWSMGSTGPCGPCTEIFYDHGEAIFGGLPGTKDADGDRFTEIWNIVFMESEMLPDGKTIPLKTKSIDTGIGLERLTAVLQNVHNNYDIDVFKNIIKCASDITEIKENSKNSASFKVIADHLRSCSFLIADGLTPSNEGRGYVLRRILRRAVRHINLLNYNDALLHRLLPILIGEMGEHYPELMRNQKFISEILKNEEEAFRNTLDKGLAMLDKATEQLKHGSTLPGDVAFKLHDTYGFPVDLTADILKDKNISVDMLSFDEHMEEQKTRARQAWSGSGTKSIEKLWFTILEKSGPTEFIGYHQSEGRGQVIALIQGEQIRKFIDNKAQFFMITNQTPFYSESGGQVGDKGFATMGTNCKIEILDTITPIPGLHVHVCELQSGVVKESNILEMQINKSHREDIKRNHTATHLLHAALRAELGEQVTQKGSLVLPSKLRFDFNYPNAIPRQTLDKIETNINTLIVKNIPTNSEIMDKDAALSKGAVALFGEKYDKKVRVISICETDTKHSVELCGGTHVDSLGEIGQFRIISESAIAAGIRRIEAITGLHSLKLAQDENKKLKSLSEKLKTTTDDLDIKISSLLDENKASANQILKLKESTLLEKLNTAAKIKIHNIEFLEVFTKDLDIKNLRNGVMSFMKNNTHTLLTICDSSNGQLSCLIGSGDAIQSTVGANVLFKVLADKFDVKGGGNASIAQGASNTHTDAKIISSEIKHFLEQSV